MRSDHGDNLSDNERPAEPLADHSVTLRGLFWFTLPLALTFIMMSGSAPLVSNGIAWIQDAAGEGLHLSAFLMTFAIALFIYSPLFVARNVSIRTVVDRRSMKRFLGFFTLISGICSLELLAVSQIDLIGHAVFGELLGTDPIREELARRGLLLFVPIPILVALRGLGQGCHISNGQGWYVGWGTAMRFATMATFVFGFAVHTEMEGPMLGGGVYLSGIGVETLFVLALLRNKPQWTHSDEQPVLSYRQFFIYAGPLMLSAMLTKIVTPILILMINNGRQPAENGATFNLLRDTGWVMLSMLMSLQPTVLSHATSRRNLRKLVQFAAIMTSGVTLMVCLVALTPLKQAIFIDWFEVDNVVIQNLTFTALLFLIPLPAISVANHFLQAMHTRSGRTMWVTLGTVVGLIVLLVAVKTFDLSGYHGAILAISGEAGFMLIAAIVQAIGLFNGGLDAVVSRGHLAEHYHRTRSERAAKVPARPQPDSREPGPAPAR